ncbi:hypothetical protein DPMN_028952 [Dreissena polymorpha]|uniref:Uncharacterized protein n=1 Tax=Dreissena polymorpha TaxID=45954 RepID=A0A9D4RGX9_DREPO|nr:hypothetical protein DPMN_028952 [Dreissena polymorpha]
MLFGSSKHKPPKIVSSKHGTTPAVTGSRGKNVTVFCCVNGPSLLDGGTPGTNGTVSPTGWSTTEVFSDYLKEHALQYLPPRSQDEPAALHSNLRASGGRTLSRYDVATQHSQLPTFKLPSVIVWPHQPVSTLQLQVMLVNNEKAEQFLQKRGGKILQNVDTAKKQRKTLSKVKTKSSFRKSRVEHFHDRNWFPDHPAALTADYLVVDDTKVQHYRDKHT